jgi:protein TonB
LNFGLDREGSGDVQPTTPAGSQRPTEDDVEQSKEEAIDEDEVPAVKEEVKPQETKPVEQPVATQKESPVAVKEEKKTETKPVEKPKEQPREPVKTETKPVEQKVDEKSTYKPTADKTTTDNKEGKPVSQGDDANKTGDKGDPQGKIDADAMYGKQGGGAGGAGLDLAGWNWDFIPKPNVPNNESGRVVFEIKVDGTGEIISIKTLERSVSLEAETICRKEIEKLTFSKTGTNVPALSTGKITFIIRSN